MRHSPTRAGGVARRDGDRLRGSRRGGGERVGHPDRRPGHARDGPAGGSREPAGRSADARREARRAAGTATPGRARGAGHQSATSGRDRGRARRRPDTAPALLRPTRPRPRRHTRPRRRRLRPPSGRVKRGDGGNAASAATCPARPWSQRHPRPRRPCMPSWSRGVPRVASRSRHAPPAARPPGPRGAGRKHTSVPVRRRGRRRRPSPSLTRRPRPGPPRPPSVMRAALSVARTRTSVGGPAPTLRPRVPTTTPHLPLRSSRRAERIAPPAQARAEAARAPSCRPPCCSSLRPPQPRRSADCASHRRCPHRVTCGPRSSSPAELPHPAGAGGPVA